MSIPVQKSEFDATIKSIKEHINEHDALLDTKIEAMNSKIGTIDSTMGAFYSKIEALSHNINLLNRNSDKDNAAFQTVQKDGSGKSTVHTLELGFDGPVPTGNMIAMEKAHDGYTQG